MTATIFFTLHTLLALCFHQSVCAITKSPVVIVPGSAGSQLEAKLNKPSTIAWYCSSSTSSYFRLWLNIPSLLPKSSNCWADNMRLEWDMKTMSVNNAPGVLTRTPGFGGTSSIETLDSHGLVKYMKPFVDDMVANGYTRGTDIRGAPYDFRYSPDHLPEDYHNKLKLLIEETYSTNSNRKVTLVSHSYGCPVVLYFLSLQTKIWKEMYLQQWISLSGIFGGSIHLVHLYASGDFQGLPDFVFDRDIQRKGQRSGTSNLFLLPSLPLWPNNDVIAITKTRKYRISDMDDFLKDVGFPEGIPMRRHISNTSSLMTTSPGIPVYCFHGNIANSTTKKLIFSDNFPDKPDVIERGDGDETVNSESLNLCARFSTTQRETVRVKVVNGVNHNGILSNDITLAAIRRLLFV